MRKKIVRAAGKIFIVANLLSMILCPYVSQAGIESNPSVPQIISRKAWGADESMMTWPIEYASVQKIVVHHTASTSLVPDTDGSSQYKSMVNAIYKYHTSSKTWTDENGVNYTGFGDIGYNYVIDPNGNIYEGRAGGNGVIGGHVTGFNTGSVGISIIGNYQDGAVGQTNTTLSNNVKVSLEKLIGWIAANNGIDVNKTSNFLGKSIDGVVGHKDLGATQCPGNVIYDQLNDVQQQAALYAKEYQKDVYQIQGDSAVYVISGGYKTKFASKSALPAAYQSKTIQYVSKSQLDAYKYKDAKVFPDGTLLQVKGESTVYYLESGKKRAMSISAAEFLRLGFKTDDIVTVDSSDLDFYGTGDIIKFGPEGSLIKDANNNVYLIQNGKKRSFTSAQLFEYLKYSWTKVKSDPAADYYLTGDIMTYLNGTLIKSKDSPSVYLMQDGQKRTFTSGALFEKLGYKWNSILTIAASEINSYPLGANVVYPNGTLIRGTGTSTVYLVDNGQKREITSATLLGKLGYSFGNIIDIPVISLLDYPNGPKAVYPNGTLIKIKGGSAVYRVSTGGKEEFTSLNVFNASGAKWANVVEISQDEMNLYATVGTVKYPDGSLIKASDDQKIYVIKNGQAIWIKTGEEFTKAGYKWANVMTIDPQEMKLYVVSTPVVPTTPTAPTTPTTPTTPTNPTTPTVPTGTEPNMRVAIMGVTDAASTVSVTANGNYKIEYRRANGDIYKTVQKKSGEVTDTAFFTWDNYIRFVPESDSVILQVLSYSDVAADKVTNDNKFRGNIELRYSTVSSKLWVIEDVPLEGYLRGISEATSRSNPEYLKAFSIITRTYAMNYIVKGGKYAGEPFYLKNSRNGNGNDQQYKGYALEMRSPTTANSYGQTTGQVIDYKGKPIVAAYSSDSGGVTKDGCSVLSKNYCTDDYAYLRGGVKDPDDTVHNPASVAASHGAGMSAAGAYQMAVDGSDWKTIITTYYPGVVVDKYY